jgi:CheY-like chemotaxis protein
MSNPNVIIADPDRDFRSALRVQLDAIGFVSFVAMDAREAIERATQQQPRLVILDVGLPRLGAFEACVRIRRLPDCRAVPILLVTLIDRPQIRAAATRAGASGLLVKPFSVSDLLRQLTPFVADPFGQVTWREIGGPASPMPPGMAEPARQIWTIPARSGEARPQPAPLAQGLQMLDVMRRREAKRDGA